MMGTKTRSFTPLPHDISLEDLVPENNFYRRLERTLDLSFVRELVGEIVRHPPKMAPQEVMKRWAEGWAKEGVCRSIQRSSQGRGGLEICLEKVGSRAHLFVVRTEPSDEQRDYERLPESSEAFVYVGMTRLMVRRLARS